MAGTFSVMIITSGYPSLFIDWDSFFHCCLVLHASTKNGVAPLVLSLSPSDVGSCPSVKNPCLPQEDRFAPLAVVCERLTALRHQHRQDTNRDMDSDRMPRVQQSLDPMASWVEFSI